MIAKFSKPSKEVSDAKEEEHVPELTFISKSPPILLNRVNPLKDVNAFNDSASEANP